MKKQGRRSGFLRAEISGRFSVVFAAVFILCSAASFFLIKYLENLENESEKQTTLIVKTSSGTDEEVFSVDTQDGFDLAQGFTAASEPLISVEEGECFARFTVTLSDSDGTAFSDELDEIQKNAKEYKSYLDDEDLASYEAFSEAYYDELNDYIMTEAKCKLIFSLFCRGNGMLQTDETYGYEELLEMAEDGDIAYISGMDSSLCGELELMQITYSDMSYKRQYILKESLCAGESFSLFTNIVVPNDWNDYEMNIMLYEKNSEGEFGLVAQQINCLELLGEGFGVSVETEVVEAEDFTNPLAAFEVSEKYGR